jgi:predicted nucleic acid-binding protein
VKLLIDTNVILDVFLLREPNSIVALEIFKLIKSEKVEAFTTASSITDIYYITEKRLGENKARTALRNLINLLGIISVEGEDCVQALDLPLPDFEDALVTVCATKADIDYIITNDSGFLETNSEDIQIVTPKAFLNIRDLP